MIELTTGVIFLMSSLYGSQHADMQVANIANAQMQTEKVEKVAIEKIRDPKDIEAYIRKEFSDKPILIEIAWCESRFRQFNENGTVIRGLKNSKDVGVMQINERFHAEDAVELGYDIYSTQGNTAFGKYLYEKYGTDPWSASRKCWSQSGDIAKK